MTEARATYMPSSKETEGLVHPPGHSHKRITGTTPLYALRANVLFCTIAVSAAAIALGFVAVHKATQQKSAIASHFSALYSVKVVVDMNRVYIPNMITSLAAVGLLVCTILAFMSTFSKHRSSHFTSKENLMKTFKRDAVLILICSVVMTASLIFETIGFARHSVKVTLYDGQSIPPWDLDNAFKELGIAGRFYRVNFWQRALGVQWGANILGMLSIYLLLLASRRIQAFTIVSPEEAAETEGGNQPSNYHYTKRTSAANLDGPMLKRMSARDVAHPVIAQSEIAMEPRSPAGNLPQVPNETRPDEETQYSDGEDIALEGPRSPHTPVTPMSPVSLGSPARVGSPQQLPALQADAEGDIVEVPLDKVAPPVRVLDQDDGAHSFVQNDDGSPQMRGQAL